MDALPLARSKQVLIVKEHQVHVKAAEMELSIPMRNVMIKIK